MSHRKTQTIPPPKAGLPIARILQRTAHATSQYPANNPIPTAQGIRTLRFLTAHRIKPKKPPKIHPTMYNMPSSEPPDPPFPSPPGRRDLLSPSPLGFGFPRLPVSSAVRAEETSIQRYLLGSVAKSTNFYVASLIP